MSNMFSTNQNWPISGFIKTLVVLSAVGSLVMIGAVVALIVWLFTHVHIG
jgi:hypothetical protein